MKPMKRVSMLWTPSGEQKMIRVIEVGRERFGERNHRRAGKNVAADFLVKAMQGGWQNTNPRPATLEA